MAVLLCRVGWGDAQRFGGAAQERCAGMRSGRLGGPTLDPIGLVAGADALARFAPFGVAPGEEVVEAAAALHPAAAVERDRLAVDPARREQEGGEVADV